MTTVTMDQQRAEAFAGRVIDMLNGGMLSLQMSVGHRTGLFDVMSGMGPATSAEIAKAGSLNERYVREWLGALVTGGIVAYDPREKTYVLPAEHAASLTRAAGPGNLASFAQYTAELGKVEDGIVEAFRNGGGVPYSAFPRFQEVMREESGQVFDATLIDVTLALVPGLVEKLEGGCDVADVGCGSGHAVNIMARAFPKSHFRGFDFSDEGIARGSAEAAEWGLGNATFELRDAASLEMRDRFDLITTFDSVHDQAKPRQVLKGIFDALKPGGTYLCVDIAASSQLEDNIAHPLGPMLYSISTFHCMTVSLALGGEGLGTVWGEQMARELLAEAGFTDVRVARVEGDIQNNYYVATKR